ncbi:MAG: SRPBCC family protein [Oligoflexales bacterium]
MSNSVELHRVIKAPVGKVFKAFSDPMAKATWIPPFGFLCKVHNMDFKVGGGYKMSFINFTTGGSHSFFGTFIEIQPNKLIRCTDQFEDPNLPGEIIVTIQFREVMCGTELRIKQENLPAVIPVEMCYLGWQESLIKLAQLVEPNIPEG